MWTGILRFVLIFVILGAPWPGLKDLSGRLFCAVGEAVFANDQGLREVDFDLRGKEFRGDVRVTVANRAILNPDGSGQVRYLDLFPFALVWQANALFVALALAVPGSWRRRSWAVPLGLVLIHLYLLLFLSFAIWNESRYVGLAVLGPLTAAGADWIEATLLRLNGTITVFVWIVLFLRPRLWKYEGLRRLFSAKVDPKEIRV